MVKTPLGLMPAVFSAAAMKRKHRRISATRHSDWNLSTLVGSLDSLWHRPVIFSADEVWLGVQSSPKNNRSFRFHAPILRFGEPGSLGIEIWCGKFYICNYDSKCGRILLFRLGKRCQTRKIDTQMREQWLWSHHLKVVLECHGHFGKL